MVPTQLREACATRVWPLALLLTAVAAVALFTSAPGRLISDGQLELYWSPGRVLARQAAAWDPGRGLGAVRTEFWPVPAAVLGVVRLVGASAVVTERLWHLALLVTGGVGMIGVLRLRRPRIGIEHAMAALVYMFNPFTAVLITPWTLFIGYALAPWFVVAFVRGVTDDRPWRWAAMLALLVFVPGALNMAAVTYAAVPLLGVAVYLVHVDRVTDWRRVGGWIVRALALSLAVSLAAVVASGTGDSSVVADVAATPRSDTVNRFSSWSESWRGLGYWRVDALPDAYLDRWPLVLVSFLAPCGALAALWLVRNRLRLLFGAVMVVGLVAMVGTFPVDDPPPLGRALREVFDALPRGRATYLAGPAVMFGLAGLVGLGVAAAALHLRGRRPRLAMIPVVVAVAAAVGVGAFPFWTGDLYADVDRAEDVPEQWQRALAWLDEQPGDGRVLVLADGGDVIDALLRRPHVQSGDGERFEETPLSADLLTALDRELAGGAYRAGTLAPIARRLGIRYVVGDGATAAVDPLRSDPDLGLTARFGGLDVFEIAGVDGVVRVEPPSPPLLVSGDGGAWPLLAAAGRLPDGRAVRYTAGASPGELADALERGAELVVTDTDTGTMLSSRPGTASIVDLGGAALSETGVTDPDAERSGRPAAAFDDNPATAWSPGGVPEAATIRIDLPEPVDIGELTIRRTTGGPRISEVTVRFSQGDDVPLDLVRPVTIARLPPRATAWLEIRVDGVTGSGPATPGIAEIAAGVITLSEEVELPDDVVRAAAQRPELRTLLRTADVTYVVTARTPEGTALHRRFRTPGRRSYRVTGTVRLTTETPPAVIYAAAVGGCHGGILTLDGVDVPVRLDPAGGDVVAGDPARFRSCDDVSLGAGRHRFDTAAGLVMEHAALRSPAASPPSPTPPTRPVVEVVERTPTRLRVVVTGAEGSVLATGQSFHDGWRATIDGESLGPPLPLDTLTAWSMPEGGRHEIVVTFGPQGRHDLALLVTFAAVAGCAWLAAHRRRS